jgi:hypothetical protein
VNTLELRTESVDFSLPLRGNGPRISSKTVVFTRPVTTAIAGLSGYTIGYSSGSGDHHLGRLEVNLDVSTNNNTVTVNVTFGLRDWSGNWDDDYEGQIEFVVVAELQSITSQPPRSDLIITGVEINQAVQFFRASSYLDAGNVLPDNAIWPVARKMTGVRVYVDWDPSAGLPSIAYLTGNAIVNTGNTTLTLNPINPGQAIIPLRDSQINMAIANNTLNFAIPAAWCVGTIVISFQVWDQNSPTSKSASFTKSIVFNNVKPLSLFFVGIDYTAVNPPLPAPTQAQIFDSLSHLIKIYPVGDIIQTGYTTIAFNEIVTGTIADGCTDGMEELVDRLDDLRGDSEDIYLGSLPATISSTMGNEIAGCAPTPGNVAATFVDERGGVSHEVTHALGRQHAPCAMGCNKPPKNPDPNYPQYGAFPSDSIGVFGFDPTTNNVLNPATIYDIMAYNFPRWISPYTYNGLRGSYFTPISSSQGAGPISISGVKVRVLFLGLVITRERHVTRRVSFNYMAPILSRYGQSDFTVEFLDEKRRPLNCSSLQCDRAHSSCTCWPKVIRDQVHMPDNARWLIIWEDDKKIYEEEIPEPPVVKIESAVSQTSGVLLKWSSNSSTRKKLWYLVHWYDERAKVWRGVAPRLQETFLLIPSRLFVEKPELLVRVLASSGIATGVVEGSVKLDNFRPLNMHIMIRGIDTKIKEPQSLPNVIDVIVLDTAGRQAITDRIKYYDTDGTELAIGHQIDLRQLSEGRHLIRAVVRGLTGGLTARSWLIERTREKFLFHNEVCDPKPKIVKEEHKHPHPPPDKCDGGD